MNDQKLFAERRRVVDARESGRRTGLWRGYVRGFFVGAAFAVVFMAVVDQILIWFGR